MENVIKPKKRNPLDTSPSYLGYLWKNKDSQKRAPHEVIPLDFTPANLPYPTEWKNMFATKGFMLALHVPSSFARYKIGLQELSTGLVKVVLSMSKSNGPFLMN